MRTTIAVQGRNIHFQFSAACYHALQLGQRGLRSGQSLSSSKAVNVLCSLVTAFGKTDGFADV